MPKRERKQGLTGKPVLIDELTPELGGKVVQAVIDDMDRAAEQRGKDPGKADAPAKRRRKAKGKRR